MSYNAENCKKIADEYAFSRKRKLAEERANARRAQLHALFPEVKEIDAALSRTGLAIFSAAAMGEQGIEARIAELKKSNEELLAARAAVLTSNGYPADYSDVKYECELCHDEGYRDGVMCSCMRRALIAATFESSGVGSLVTRQNFGNFDISYYTGADREQMSNVYESVRAFASDFSEKNGRNLLFIGKTGLGKTHLSSAVAKEIIERGFDVVYESAQNIFSDFEYERFSKSYNSGEEDRTRKYFSCDLLIIDDLGTEMVNQFTASCLYNIINTRMCAGRSMIINTNLGKDELFTKYADRITSRLFGEFEICLFVGKDVRSQKLVRREY